jgi:hypothetical protein
MSEDRNGESTEQKGAVETTPEEALQFFRYLAENGIEIGIQGTSANRLQSVQKYGLIPGARVTDIDSDPSVISGHTTAEQLVESLKARARETSDLVYALNLSPQHNPVLQEAIQQGNATALLEHLRNVVSGAFEHYHTQDANGAVVILRTNGFELGGNGGTPLTPSIRKAAPVEPSDILATFRSTSSQSKPLPVDVDRTVKQVVSLRPAIK